MSRFFVPDLRRSEYLDAIQTGQTDLAIAQMQAAARERRRQSFVNAMNAAMQPLGEAMMMRARLKLQQRLALDSQTRAKYGMGIDEIEQAAAAKGVAVRDITAELDDSIWERDMARKLASNQIEYDLTQKNELQRIRNDIDMIEKARAEGEISPQEYSAAMQYKRMEKYRIPFRPAPPPENMEDRFFTDSTGRRWVKNPTQYGMKLESADDDGDAGDRNLQRDIDAAEKKLEERAAVTGMDYEPADLQREVLTRRATREAIRTGKPMPVRPLSEAEAADYANQKRIVDYYANPNYPKGRNATEVNEQLRQQREAQQKVAAYERRMAAMSAPPATSQPASALSAQQEMEDIRRRYPNPRSVPDEVRRRYLQLKAQLGQ